MTILNSELGQLEEAELVRRLAEAELAYTFKHALTQDTVSQSLLRKTRRDIHRQVADAYAQLYANRDEFVVLLAEHYWQGEVWDRAAECALRAGEHAMRAYALPEALTQFDRALHALDQIHASPEQRIDATLNWIRPAIKLEPFPELLERLAAVEQMARELNDKHRLAQVLHWIANVHFAAGHTTRAVPALFENYRLATEVGDERLSMVPSFWLAFFMVDRDPRGALAQFGQVIELARKHHNPEIEAYAFATQALAHARLGRFALARRELKQALGILDSFSSPMGQADVNTLSGYTYLEMGQLEAALRYTQRGAEKARKAKVYECEVAGMVGVGFCQLQGRSFAEAQRTFEESQRLAEAAGSDHLRSGAMVGLAVAHYLNGEKNAIAEMETALANSQAIGDENGTGMLLQTLAEAYVVIDPARAERYLGAALEFYRRNEMRPYIARTLQIAATLYDRQGKTMEAEQARAEAQKLIDEIAVANVEPIESMPVAA